MRSGSAAALALMCCLIVAPAGGAEIIRSVPHRDASQRYAVLAPERPARAVMLLYVGGEGTLRLESGAISSVNVLFRIRDQLLAAGVRLIYVDRPDGRHARADAEYAKAAALIVARENAERLPVFVVGMSRGSISAVNVAARVPVSGVVLLSGAVSGTHDGTMRDAPHAAVAVPSLLLLHRRDACVASNSERGLRSFAAEMPKSRSTIIVMDGGTDEAPGRGRPAECHPRSHHGFNGIEADVAAEMVKWLDLHLPTDGGVRAQPMHAPAQP
ncbi:MAG TPA: hypothetical protein VED01_21430 [Burkholderiales bacterium]|nr:hypothetical protein [Burkholderiales bacterium]